MSRAWMVLGLLATATWVVVGDIVQCEIQDPVNFKFTCAGHAYDLSTLGIGYASDIFIPGPGLQAQVFYFQMLSGGLPSSVSGPGTQKCIGVTGGAVVEQYTSDSGCHTVAALPINGLSYDTTQMAIQLSFVGGEAGRSAVITILCDPNGDGLNSFSYDSENYPVYSFSLRAPQACSLPPVVHGDYNCSTESKTCISVPPGTGFFRNISTCAAGCATDLHYRCIHDQCVLTSNVLGMPYLTCLENCGPATYRCIENTCTETVKGVNKSFCELSCGPGMTDKTPQL